MTSGVLGEGAVALHRVACALDSVRDRLTEYGAGFFEEELRARPYDHLCRLEQEMDALTEQLSVNLGREHEAAAAFAAARAAVCDIVRALDLLRDRDSHQVFNRQKVADEAMEQLEGRRATFDACRDQFMDAPRDPPAGR